MVDRTRFLLEHLIRLVVVRLKEVLEVEVSRGVCPLPLVAVRQAAVLRVESSEHVFLVEGRLRADVVAMLLPQARVTSLLISVFPDARQTPPMLRHKQLVLIEAERLLSRQNISLHRRHTSMLLVTAVAVQV